MNQATDHPSLEGLRILIVEDEAQAALMIEDMLEILGCTVIGPAARVEHALQLVARESVDLAVLDLNIAGELVYPVAQALAQRAKPFFFATRRGRDSVEQAYRACPVLQKPFTVAKLRDAIIASLSTL